MRTHYDVLLWQGGGCGGWVVTLPAIYHRVPAALTKRLSCLHTHQQKRSLPPVSDFQYEIKACCSSTVEAHTTLRESDLLGINEARAAHHCTTP